MILPEFTPYEKEYVETAGYKIISKELEYVKIAMDMACECLESKCTEAQELYLSNKLVLWSEYKDLLTTRLWEMVDSLDFEIVKRKLAF